MEININESIEFLINNILARIEEYSLGIGDEVFKSDRQFVQLDKKKYGKKPKLKKKSGTCC